MVTQLRRERLEETDLFADRSPKKNKILSSVGSSAWESASRYVLSFEKSPSGVADRWTIRPLDMNGPLTSLREDRSFEGVSASRHSRNMLKVPASRLMSAHVDFSKL
jgi:hypothetical protein